MSSPSRFSIPVYSLKLVRERKASYPVASCPGPDAVAAILHAELDDKPREHLVAIFLNAQAQPVGLEHVAVGGLTSCATTAREILQGALLANSASVVVGHNHIAGSLRASAADVAMTKALAVAARAVGIPLVDHVIVTPEGGHLSLRDGDHGIDWG